MKKNLGLFGVLVLLLTVTYFFQEKRVEKNYQESLTKDRLLTEALTHLKLPHLEATKKDGSWWSGEILLSHNTFKTIEQKISEIKEIKKIEGDWKNYFPHPFEFEVNHEKWTIGDQSLDKQGFYVAKGEKIYLAIIEGESTHLTQNESEVETMKLNELIVALSKPMKDLVENQLFRFYPKLPKDRVVLAVEGSLPFELKLLKDETIPPPIKGITVHRNLLSKFTALLTQMTIKEEVPYSEKLKYKKMGEVKFIGENNEETWELWLESDKSANAYITDAKNKRAFLMVGGTLRLFFVQLQDYWDKKVIPPSDFKSFNRLEVKFRQGSKEASVTVLNREPLAFEVKGFKVEQLRMEQLFQVVFNLGPMDQANRVSQLTSTERKQVLSEEHLQLELMGQELVLWRKSQELIVVNLTQGYKAHFNLMDENFNARFEDVLK